MEEYRDDKKSKLYYMDEILHKISSMSQAENEKQLDDITPSILKSVGKYAAAEFCKVSFGPFHVCAQAAVPRRVQCSQEGPSTDNTRAQASAV